MASREIAISIALTFVFEKPRSARKTAVHKTTKPDLDKLLRAVLDGLTGIVYQDDSQVCECRVSKAFGSPARLELQVRAIPAGVPKTPKTETPQLFETTRPVFSKSDLSKTHVFGTGANR